MQQLATNLVSRFPDFLERYRDIVALVDLPAALFLFGRIAKLQVLEFPHRRFPVHLGNETDVIQNTTFFRSSSFQVSSQMLKKYLKFGFHSHETTVTYL